MSNEAMKLKIQAIINWTMRDLGLHLPEDEDIIVEAAWERMSKDDQEWLARKRIDQLITEELGGRTEDKGIRDGRNH